MDTLQALPAASDSAFSASPSRSSTATFESLGLAPALAETVRALGYSEPTPIQTRAIPDVLSGRDVLGLAQTGTGKTAAFLLPIIHKLLEGESGSPRVLVVVPTRELAEQVLEAARAYCEGTDLRAMSMYGGVRIESQIRQLRQPLDIIVGCPGRILDLLEQRALSLSSIEYLVLDEADQMFDMGFIVPIRKLLKALPRDRQSLLFSATMPREISGLADEALHDPVKIQVAPISSPGTVTHFAYPVSAHLKQKLLTHLLKTMSSESVLIFTRTKHKAKKLARYLEREGVLATSLQGNLSQQQRMHAMKGFRNGKYSVMVATDIASRGIDVSSVTHVVNFDLPDTTEAYLHRTGRTGRAARNGDALSFITPSDESELRRFEKTLRIPFKRKTAEGFDYAANPDPDENTIGGFSHAGRGGDRRGPSQGRFRGSRGGGRGFRGERSGGRSGESRFEGRRADRSTAEGSRSDGGRAEGGHSENRRRRERGHFNDRPNRSFDRHPTGERTERVANDENRGNRESANRSRPIEGAEGGYRGRGGRHGGGHSGGGRPHRGGGRGPNRFKRGSRPSSRQDSSR